MSGGGGTVVRHTVAFAVLPLCLLAGALAATPWLRAFPAGIWAVPLVGAAVLSGLVAVAGGLFLQRLGVCLAVDLAAFVVYTLIAVLHRPFAVGELVQGIYHGPSQLLTFALPLVSPRSLAVAPTALIWLAGALAGECVVRRWFTALPYVAFLTSFGLAYAATERAAGAGSAAHRNEVLLAAGLLITLLLLRVAQSWVRQDESAEATQPDAALPLRSLAVGGATALLVVLVAAFAVAAPAFPRRDSSLQRVPSVDRGRPVTPVSFIAGLRPANPKAHGTPVFTVRLNHRTPGYFDVANLDEYDGAGWSFDRTFRPSGGVLPEDADRALDPTATVRQDYRIGAGPLSSAPWMPFVYRPERVSGIGVNADPGSGMIVPERALGRGATYTVTSSVPAVFDQVPLRQAVADTVSTSTDTPVPATLRSTLDKLISSFSAQLGVPTTPALPFLAALQHQLRTKYALTGQPSGAGGSPSTATGAPSAPASSGSAGATSGAAATSGGAAAQRAGGTGFADILASLGLQRAGTPEQFATLMALVARDLGVPARVATGFRVLPSQGGTELAPGSYAVTTAEAWTWAEIPLVGAGWVILDAAPGQYANAPVPVGVGAHPSPSPSATPTHNAQITKANGGHAVAGKSAVPATTGSSAGSLLVALLVVLVVLALLLAVGLGSRKRLRAKRRSRSPDPRTRLLGAWLESLDVLSEAGLPDLGAMTSHEIAQLTQDQFGDEPATQTQRLGQLANAVAFSSTTVVTTQEADDAWVQHRALRVLVRDQLSPAARLAAGLRYRRTGRLPRIRARGR